MSGQNDGQVHFRGAATPNNLQPAIPDESANADQGTGQNDSEPITRKEVLSLLENQKTEVLRQTQGLTDKVASRFDKELAAKLEPVNSALAVMKANGVTVPPETEMKMRQDAYDKALAEAGGSSQAGQSGGEPAPAAKETDDAIASMVNEQAAAIFKKYGVQVLQDDPEAAKVSFENPFAFISTLEQAAAAKAQRQNIPPEGRLSSLGTGQSYTEDEATLTARLEELQKNPNSNVKERKELFAKLQALTKKA